MKGCGFAWVFAMACAGSSLAQPIPLSYECHYTAKPLKIDGKLEDAAWRLAAWTGDFSDIRGDTVKKPVFRTRVKMLWDDRYLYIAAEMEEPDVHGTLTVHDSVIFHDNDFEVFLKPMPRGEAYFEYEINALNTTWDLYLNKPYRAAGKADSSWEATGMKSAVAVRGTLNHPEDRDKVWTVEIALPFAAFASRQPVPHPVEGTVWRANFSRVEWMPGHPREENWVWTSQGEIDMHVPERWGYLRFRR